MCFPDLFFFFCPFGWFFYSFAFECIQIRFVPSVNAVIYHGDKNQRDEIRRKHMPRSIGPNFPIILTSYEVALNDARRVFRHYNWKYLVIDEVSNLTNSSVGCFCFK